MRITKDEWAMGLALTTAQRSTCCRRQVGCVMLNEKGHVLCTGYNGVAAGMPHCNHVEAEGGAPGQSISGSEYVHKCPGAFSPSGTNLDACRAIHAEQNALLQCPDVWAIDSIFTTTSPCITCVKLLMNTSCKRIVFVEEYPHADSKDLWIEHGRLWVQMDKPRIWI